MKHKLEKNSQRDAKDGMGHPDRVEAVNPFEDEIIVANGADNLRRVPEHNPCFLFSSKSWLFRIVNFIRSREQVHCLGLDSSEQELPQVDGLPASCLRGCLSPVGEDNQLDSEGNCQKTRGWNGLGHGHRGIESDGTVLLVVRILVELEMTRGPGFKPRLEYSPYYWGFAAYSDGNESIAPDRDHRRLAGQHIPKFCEPKPLIILFYSAVFSQFRRVEFRNEWLRIGYLQVAPSLRDLIYPTISGGIPFQSGVLPILTNFSLYF